MDCRTGGSRLNKSVQLLLVSGAVLAIAALPSASADLHVPEDVKDISKTIDAGQWYGVQVDASEGGRVVFSGQYDDVNSEQPVLPVMLVIDRVETDHARIWVGFVYADEGSGAYGYVRTPVAERNFTTYDRNHDGTSVSVSTPVDAGTYNVFVATGPADGPAEANIRIPGTASVTKTAVDTTIFERGIEHSAVGWDVTVRSDPLLQHARSWGYSGADVPFTVDDALHGYMGGPPSSGALWIAPNREPIASDFIRSGPSGDWTASFPPEQYQGPVCNAATSCFPQPFRADPPYAMGIDSPFETG
jgi:hypothetical protein